ncbi:hypothetical protein CRG98_039596 [Punica granatum]|uniref:Integrase catalytic domain-containing protein n=1 Tax=Punica granatum TaxID=22663 RepID=A0A2I0I9I5_PUNGR|nr:hypothetical protein CRG98_039596 [Punica granatum]
MGNGQSCKIIGIGDVCLETELGCKLLLKKVRHIPEIRLNLISTGQLDDEGYNQVTQIFKNFHVVVESETGMKLKCVRTDNGGEYRGHFENYCRTHDIKLEKTVPKTPQQNGLAERMNRTIVERVRCMLSQEKLLRKSLYGLKQAPRQWYKKFDFFMLSHGYTRTTSDHCVFVKQFSNDDFIILLLYNGESGC